MPLADSRSPSLSRSLAFLEAAKRLRFWRDALGLSLLFAVMLSTGQRAVAEIVLDEFAGGHYGPLTDCRLGRKAAAGTLGG